jgi:ABC-type transport system substrate-binding protein
MVSSSTAKGGAFMILFRRFLGRKALFLIPALSALLLAVACGGSAQPAVAPVDQPTAVAAKPVAKATVAPAPVATKAPVVEPIASGGPGLATFDLKTPIINLDRSRAPEGTLNLAYHTALSPKWLDPQKAPASRTPYSAFLGNVFDPMIGATKQGSFTLLLAEHFEMTEDFTKATLRLRDGVKFHDGSTVTTADVKFTYENYSGALADIFHDNTASIEVVDDKTIVFNLNKPFIDFLLLYGSQAAGIGYIVPAKYYQKVGPDGFKEAPIGTGPYKVVGQTTGQEVVMDAFDDYWRQRPNIKT